MAQPRRVPPFCAAPGTIENLIEDIETFWRECQDLAEEQGIPSANPIVHKPRLVIEYPDGNPPRPFFKVIPFPGWIIDPIGDPAAKPGDREKAIERLRKFIENDLTIGWRDLEDPKAVIKFLCTPKNPNIPKMPYKEGESDPIYLVPGNPIDLRDPAQNPIQVQPR